MTICEPSAVLAAFHAALNGGPNLDRVASLLAPGYHHDVGGRTIDRDSYLAMQRAFCSGFSDFSVECSLLIADGPWVSAHVMVRGCHTGTFLGHQPSGRSFASPGIDLFRVDNGCFIEGRGIFDTVSMLHQLDLYREFAA